VRIATEGLLVGSLLHDAHGQHLVIVSAAAGPFAVPLLIHGLCWVHAERTLHKLNPGSPFPSQAVDSVRGDLWTLYAGLKAYRAKPDEAQRLELAARFETIFTQQTGYLSLDLALRRLYRQREEWRLVLKRPDVPLHTNGSEQDLRDPVVRRNIRGGTRSDWGRQCRDTFLSLKQTCRKLGVSFWQYLLDRIQGDQVIPPLTVLIRRRANTLAAQQAARGF
jgi:Transposase IS66 family